MKLQSISPDLTRADVSKFRVSRGLTVDSRGAEHYSMNSTFVESSHQDSRFFVGSNDGLVQTVEGKSRSKHW